jgi:transglutaminase-like putative cysteine protease
MNPAQKLSDSDHPSIQAVANEISAGKTTVLEKVESAFVFVRDKVKFGFPPKWDDVKASETIRYGLGYCNTKATLFRALCRAINVPARIHTSLIDIKIMRGIFPSMAFPFLPSVGDHSWLEIEIEGVWKPVDSYINDKPFYQKALQKLETSGNVTGCSISHAKGSSSCEFNFGETGFVHMGAVVEDHGVG